MIKHAFKFKYYIYITFSELLYYVFVFNKQLLYCILLYCIVFYNEVYRI